MATERRIGSESSETRKRLLDIAERLMLDEGYAAVTSRRVASLAGVNPALVHCSCGCTSCPHAHVGAGAATRRPRTNARAGTSAPRTSAIPTVGSDPVPGG